MFIELWERFRGFDRWTEVEAKIESSTVHRTSHVDRAGNVSYTWSAGDRLVWSDSSGRDHSAKFGVDDESSLYQMVGGETIAIRYNPENPGRFYMRALLQSRVRRFFQIARYTFIFLVVLGALVWLNIATRAK